MTENNDGYRVTDAHPQHPRTPPAGWWLHYEAVVRRAVPVPVAVLTNCHDNTEKESTGAGLVMLPIDEVLGWTESAQVAMDFLTIHADSLDAWLDMFVPVERRPSVPVSPVHQRKSAPDDQQVMEFPEEIMDILPDDMRKAMGEVEGTGHHERPLVVCLCGSTRFMEAFHAANARETLAGNIVLSVVCNAKTEHMTDATKGALDELHKRKIDLADEILVLNVGGYIGESTRSEIAYTRKLCKNIRYLETPGEIEGTEHQP